MSGISNYTLNQKINAILGKTSGLPSVIDLDTTLTTGNNAGANDIDMNNQDILNVDNIDLTTINGSAYPPSAIPSGAIMSYAGTTAPSGWLICDGSLVVGGTSLYPDLFAVIQYDFGGSGANFNLPNLSQRVPMGVGGIYPRASASGSATHTLTISQMPVHNHGVNDSGHIHDYGVLGVGQVGSGVAIPVNSPTFTQQTQPKVTGISIQNTGGAGSPPVTQPFNILQPYLVLYYIIKT